MIIRSLDQVIGTERDVAGDGWQSRRLLLRDDGMGFSLNDTVVQAGARLEMEYRHHLEACYVIRGSAVITDRATGQQHRLGPGSLYALTQHDAHELSIEEELHLVCVFNPALAGTERHVGGGYEPTPEN
jgi:L-ectoine synthase